MRRAARIGDGWYPQLRPGGGDPQEVLDRFRAYVREYGRNPEDVGLQTTTTITNTTPDDWGRRIEELEGLGITHVCVNTMGAGLGGPREHIEAIRRYWEVVG